MALVIGGLAAFCLIIVGLLRQKKREITVNRRQHPKYFYYISKTKVEMLLPQMRAKTPIKITSGINLGLFKADIKVEDKEESNLIDNTTLLTKELNKRGLIKPISKIEISNTKIYYSDTGTWLNGAFLIGSMGGPSMATYILWRTYGESIILLAGSPSNILGEKIAHEGIITPSTGGAWEGILNFINVNIETDEPIFDDKSFDSERFIAEKIKTGYTMEQILLKYFQSIGWTTKHPPPNALALGIFTLRYLTKLQPTKIETTFKIFRKLEMSRHESLPTWAEELRKYRYRSEDLDLEALWRYSSIYVGSPIYIALG